MNTDRSRVLVNVLKTFNVAPPGRPQKETPETLERLRSLGYIGGASAAVREQYTDADDPKRLIELEQTMTRAADAFRQGRSAEAIEMYQSVIAKRADTEDAYRKLALVYWRERTRQLRRSRRSKPRSATASRRARCASSSASTWPKLGGRTKRSRCSTDTAGDDPDALIALGNAYQLAGRTGDAIRTFTRLLEIDPRTAWPTRTSAPRGCGRRRSRGRSVAATGHSTSTRASPEPIPRSAWSSRAPIDGRKRSSAWKSAVALDGTELNALFNLTINLAAAGRRDEARMYGERFIAAAPPAMQTDVAAIRRAIERSAVGNR